MISWSISAPKPRQAAFGWYVVVGPALLAVAMWRSLWWQWLLPAEDFTLDELVWLGCSAGVILGLVTAKSGWNRRVLAVAIAAIAAVWPVVLLVVVSPPLAILFVPGVLAYWVMRMAARKDPAWRPALAFALIPLFVASLFASPPLDSYKWLWPWVSFRSPILKFQARTDEAAERLGLAVGRELTKKELEAWSAATPLRLRLRYPLLGTQVTISVINPWTNQRFPDGMVWAWWGGPGRSTFGPLDVRKMRILSAGD
jgi:hypothetical protein